MLALVSTMKDLFGELFEAEKLTSHTDTYQDWHRTVFGIEDSDPYPLLNGGRT